MVGGRSTYWVNGGTLYAGVAPDGTAFFSTSDSTTGLWKLDKLTRTFTRVVESGSYNTFQTVGNHSLIITSTLSSGVGVITHYNGTTRVAYSTGYNWITRKIVSDEVAFLGTLATNHGAGLLRYKEGNITLEVDNGQTWSFEDFDGKTFMWNLTTPGVYKYEYSALWEPSPAVVKVFESGYNWGVYKDDDVFMLGDGGQSVGIIVWENDSFEWRYTTGTYSTEIANTFKYSNDVYFIPGGGNAYPLRYNRNENLMFPLSSNNYVIRIKSLNNGYVVLWTNSTNQSRLLIHNVLTEQTTIYSTNQIYTSSVNLLDDGFTFFGSSGSYRMMWFFDYATMTKTDLITTYGFTFSGTVNLVNSVSIKDKVIVVNGDSTAGTCVYDHTLHTYTKISSLYAGGSVGSFIVKKFDESNDDDYIIRAPNYLEDYSGYFYAGVRHFKYSTNTLIEILPEYPQTVRLYVENILPNGYMVGGGQTVLSPRVYNRLTGDITLLGSAAIGTPDNDNYTYFENTSSIYWAQRAAGTGYYGIYKIDKATATVTKIYNTTSSSVYYYNYYLPDKAYIYPNIGTMVKFIIDENDVIHELDYSGEVSSGTTADQHLLFRNDKLYFSSAQTQLRGIFYLDFINKNYVKETNLGYNYGVTKLGLRTYEGKEYFLAPGYTYNFTDNRPEKFNNGANSVTPHVLGEYHFLEASTVSDFKTRQSKTFTDYYTTAPTVSNNVAVARGEYGYILYGEVN